MIIQIASTDFFLFKFLNYVHICKFYHHLQTTNTEPIIIVKQIMQIMMEATCLYHPRTNCQVFYVFPKGPTSLFVYNHKIQINKITKINIIQKR